MDVLDIGTDIITAIQVLIETLYVSLSLVSIYAIVWVFVCERVFVCVWVSVSAAQTEPIVPHSRTATIGSAAPFLLLALPPGMGFLSLSAKYPLIDRFFSFLSALKTVMFDRGWAGSASE